MSLVPDLDRW